MSVNASTSPVNAASTDYARAGALAMLRVSAMLAAVQQGHRMGRWHEMFTADVEVSYCQRCRRRVEIDLDHKPYVAGPATSEPCPRPDAFLANTDPRRV